MDNRLWRVRGRVLSPDRILTMGIVNVTPDSFSDGGQHQEAPRAAAWAARLVQQGADIIDIGGQSTRPGFRQITAEEEWGRIEPVLHRLCGAVDALISVDTFYPEVAARALAAGAHIINDVTGFRMEEMRRTAAQTGCGCVIMCDEEIAQLCPDGDEQTEAPEVPCLHSAAADLTVAAVREYFRQRLELCAADGIDPQTVVLDCGIGFGKSRKQDYILLHRMGECRVDNRPMLAAASRKRVVRRYWSELPIDEGTRCAHKAAVDAGADIVREHIVLTGRD